MSVPSAMLVDAFMSRVDTTSISMVYLYGFISMVYVQLVCLLDCAGYPLVQYTGRARLKDRTIIENS